jgi:hypothetical protein
MYIPTANPKTNIALDMVSLPDNFEERRKWDLVHANKIPFIPNRMILSCYRQFSVVNHYKHADKIAISEDVDAIRGTEIAQQPGLDVLSLKLPRIFSRDQDCP